MGDLHLEPNGLEIRDAIRHADRQLIPEAKAVFANSATVAQRLKDYCGIASTALYHPPQHVERFYCAEAEDYLLFPSRIAAMKRQELVLQALAHTQQPVRVRFIGPADHQAYADNLRDMARE